MPSTESITLAKALSVRNRLAGRLAQARTNIETYNSVLAGQVEGGASVDVRAEYDHYRKLQDGIIVVKAIIQRANDPIYEEVLQLAELKSVIQMLGGLNTKHGAEPGYNGVEFRYVAVIRKPETLEMIRKLESEIDVIQDRLNEFNASNRVEIPSWILDLAR